MGRLRRNTGESLNAWPGYVDALSTLLMVIIFVLLVFVLAQAFLSASLTGREHTLDRMKRQMTDLSTMLATQKAQAVALQAQVTQAGHDLQVVQAARAALNQQLATLTTQDTQVTHERDALRAARDQLASRLDNAQGDAQQVQAKLAEEQALADASAASNEAAEGKAEAGAAALVRIQAQLAATHAQLAAMQKAAAETDKTVQADRATLQAKLSQIAGLDQQVQALTALRDQLAKQAQAASARATAAQNAQATTASQLSDAQKLSASDEAQLALLTQQVQALRGQLASVQTALGTAQTQITDKDAKITDLGQKLNIALSQKVQELQRYRSEFFGKLSQVLANRPGVQVVGDRFVFQSDILFPPGSDELNQAGQDEIKKLATTLTDIAKDIPPDVNWLLRVDGHADKQPVDPTGNFVDNWDLSAKRAINVVKLLIADGIPASRVAATAFGDKQPIDPADTPAAYAKNRRIEIRLTDR